MKCMIYCVFIIAICLLCLPHESFCIDRQYKVCKKDRFCGKQIIRFPFYVEEEYAYCGFLGFKLTCMNHDYLLLNIDEGAYRVDEIFYSNHSLRVSNALSLDIGLCSLPKISNLHLPSDGQFQLDNYSNLVLSSNCTPESANRFSKYKVGCDLKKNETDWVLAMRSNDLNVSFAYEACRNVVLAPVDDDTAETDDYLKLMRNGFVLKYKAIDHCNECEVSGGYCGYDAEPINKFKCFCPNQPHSRSCKPDNKTRLAVILGTAIPGACIVAFLFIVCILWRRRKSKHRCLKSDTSSDIKYGSYFGVHVFSYKELEKATNNFDPSKELGEGGFGTVYYGKLRDGREVAVKRCYESNYRRVEQFLNEIHILTLLRHRNLVLLYGSTSHQSCDLLLVYEYISNGTLADHIHGDKSKTEPLTWPVRMNIAIETASALSYLHKSDIIHRDVKTNNILLDGNFCVKVADFGLSRLFPTDVTHVSTAPQGTPGYVDPEYHQCYQLTDKSDVYSFGVVLVELISSLPAVDISRQKSEINLANLALDRIQKCAIHELIDPDLGKEASTVRMTTLIAELAFRCLQIDKDLRPTMDEVLECLEQIQGRKSAFPSPAHEMEDVAMLKENSKLMDSPVAVTDKWISTSTTPRNSE